MRDVPSERQVARVARYVGDTEQRRPDDVRDAWAEQRQRERAGDAREGLQAEALVAAHDGRAQTREAGDAEQQCPPHPIERGGGTVERESAGEHGLARAPPPNQQEDCPTPIDMRAMIPAAGAP